MTLLNFPSDPASVDNIYVGPNGVTYIFDGVKWVGQSAGGGGISTQLVSGSNHLVMNPNGTVQLPYFTFPAGDGSNGQVLKTNGSGVLNWSSIDLDSLSDVTITSPSSGQVLKYNGSAWVNSADPYNLPVAGTGSGGTLGGVKVGSGLSIDGSGVISVSGGANTGNYTFSGNDMTLPNNARLNGGHFLENSPEFGTTATINSMVVMNSEIYMGAGTAESRAIVDSQGRGLMYLGVENVGEGKFAGIVARDPNIDGGQYSPGLAEGVMPTIGVGSDYYTTAVGVMNDQFLINGLFADETQTIVSTNVHAWKFDRDGDLKVPGEIRNNQGHRAIWENELPGDVAQLLAMIQGMNTSTPDTNWDGGAAAATYATNTNADGGFSSTRWGRNTTKFDGGANGEEYTLTLNGGGA